MRNNVKKFLCDKNTQKEEKKKEEKHLNPLNAYMKNETNSYVIYIVKVNDNAKNKKNYCKDQK